MNYLFPDTIPELYRAYTNLKPLSNLYPNFNNWYFDKVIPGILENKDKLILLENKSGIIGISIIKKGAENKLRCVRVNEKYQKKGYGLYLIDKSLELLNDSKPVVTVAEEMINQYSRIFINRYDFDISYVYNGIYRKSKLEYEFNGNKKIKEKTILF